MESSAINESDINEEVGLEKIFVIAARFVDALEAKQREHKEWYDLVENQQEEAFGNAMRDALTMGKEIAAMKLRRRDDVVTFSNELVKASSFCDGLIQIYKKADKREDAVIAGEFYAVIQSARAEIENWLRPGKLNQALQTGIVVGNVSFRLGNLQDRENFNQIDLLVLPVTSSGDA